MHVGGGWCVSSNYFLKTKSSGWQVVYWQTQVCDNRDKSDWWNTTGWWSWWRSFTGVILNVEGDVNKQDPGWVMGVLEGQVKGQAEHIIYACNVLAD